MRACWRCSRSYENSNRAFNHHLPWSLLLSVIFFFLFFYGVHFLQLICIQIHFVYSLSRHRLYQKQFNFAFQRFTLFRLSFYTSSARHRSERSNPKSTYGFVLTSKYATVMRRCLPKNRSCSAAAQGLLINRLERQANSLRDRVIPPSPDEQNIYVQAQGRRWRRSCRHRRQTLACAIQMAFFRENLLPAWICFTGQRQTSKRQNSRRPNVIRTFPFA